MLNFYDFEVFKYDWLVVLINPINKTQQVIVNDKEALEKYYDDHKDEIWVGYNSNHYDQYILKGILCDFNPKEINDYIIVDGNKGWQFSSLLRKFPLNNYDVMIRGDCGLKSLEGFMGNNIKETSVPFDIDRKLTKEEIAETIKYCTHDVEQTIEVFLQKQRKAEFDSRMALIKMFKLPISNISKSQAQLAAIILKANRFSEFEDEWDIITPDTLQLQKYKYVADWFLNKENHDYKKSLNSDIADCPHVFAWGGVHGAKKKYIYKCKSDELMIMADVSQLYPFLMMNYHLLSRNVPEEGYEILKDTIHTSLKLKAEHKKIEREPYKRFNNIIYGAEGDKTNAMYDPLHRNLVCVFGQLLILDLIEKIEPFTELIQSNTDGILIKLKRKDFDRFDDVVYEWEQRTGLMMEFDYYESVFQKDVNNYVVVDYEGKCKTKGAYVKSLTNLDYDLAIVNKAIVDYMLKGKHPKDTINECNDMRMFQKIVKLTSKYKCVRHNKKDFTEKCFRVFASTSSRDSFIGKVKIKKGLEVAEKFANTPEHCFIVNDDVKDAATFKKLNRQWYIDLAIERLNQFGVEV